MARNDFGEPQIWTFARLTLLMKLDSTDKRPIAIGEVMRRILGKMSGNKYQELIVRTMDGLQYGAGMPSGCEILAHLVRTHVTIADREVEDDIAKQMAVVGVDLKTRTGRFRE